MYTQAPVCGRPPSRGAALAAVALGIVLSLAAAAQGPPNILLVLIDDLGAEHVNRVGLRDDGVPLPTFEALADAGTVFPTAWAYPICSPARAAALTGLHASDHGLGWFLRAAETNSLPDWTITAAEELGAAGYATAHFGKWHLGTEAARLTPQEHGFQHSAAVFLEYQAQNFYNFIGTINGADQPVRTYQTTWIANQFLRWRAQQAGPWFAYVAFTAPHKPFHFPPGNLHQRDPADESDLNKYRAAIEAVDAELGRMLAAAAAPTLVVVLGDNGSPPEVSLPPFAAARSKGTVYEGGLRVPLVIAGWQVPAGRVDGRPASIADVLPTLLAAAGLAPSQPGLEGSSLLEPAPPGRLVRAELFEPNGLGVARTRWERAARGDGYKLIRDELDGGEELYDLTADPGEEADLLAGPLTPEQQTAYAELAAYLDGMP